MPARAKPAPPANPMPIYAANTANRPYRPYRHTGSRSATVNQTAVHRQSNNGYR